MNEVLPVPLLPGIRQDADRTLLPAGSLVRAQNVRARRVGTIGKRSPMVDAVSAAIGVTGPSQPTGLVGDIAEYQGRQAKIVGGRLYLRKTTGDLWKENGRASRALPVETHWVAYDDTANPTGLSSYSISNVSVAVLDDFTAVTYQRNSSPNAEVHLVVLDSTGVVRYQTKRGPWSGGVAIDGRQSPRVVAVDSVFLWIYQQDDGTPAHNNLYVSCFNPGLMAFTGAVPENAFTSTQNQGDGYDAVAYFGAGPSEVLIARRAGTLSLVVSRHTASQSQVSSGSWASPANKSIVVTGNVKVTAFGDADGIWAGYRDGPSTDLKSVAFDAALSTQLISISIASGANVLFAQPGIARRTSNSIWFVWAENSTADFPGGVATYETKGTWMDLTGLYAGGPAWKAHHFLPASRPFAGTLNSFQCWLHTDSQTSNADDAATNNFAWRIQRRYGLYTVVYDDGDGPLYPSPGGQTNMIVEPEFIPDDRATFAGMQGGGTVGMLPAPGFRAFTDENGTVSERGFTPVLSPIRTGPVPTTPDSLALLLYEWETPARPSGATRRIIDVGGTAVVTGGGLQEVWSDCSGVRTSEPHGASNGFARAPAILNMTVVNAAVTLIAGALYQACAVQEYIDPDGRRHRSAPSNIVSLTAPDATTSFQFDIAVAPFDEREVASDAHRSTVHVYITTGGGSIFYRATPNNGAPPAADQNGAVPKTVSFTWPTVAYGIPDEFISRGEELYTLGGVLPNLPAPPHRFGVRGGSRLWLGGLLDPRMIECSKFIVPQEPVQFTRNPAFRQLLPDACTGLAWLDDHLVAFTRRGVYLLSGTSAPNNQGAPALGQFQQLPAAVGCIDWRSIIEGPDGIFFQSARGIYLLPRGFGPPVLVSAQVQDELRGRLVVSATIVDDPGSSFGAGSTLPQHLCVFSVVAPSGGDVGRLLVYDLDRRQWISSDETGSSSTLGVMVGSWGGRLVTAVQQTTAAVLRIESPNAWATDLLTEPMLLELADIRPFQTLMWGGALRTQVLGEVRSDGAVLKLAVSTDGVYSKAVDLTPQSILGEPGDKFFAEWSLPTRQLSALGLVIQVSNKGAGAGAGIPGENLALHAIGIETTPASGRQRVGADRRAA